MKTKGSIIGAVGAVLIGGAILLFVATILINNLKTINTFGSTYRPITNTAAENATVSYVRGRWNTSNSSFEQMKTFLTVCAILLGILGIVLIGAAVIGSLGGAFGSA